MISPWYIPMLFQTHVSTHDSLFTSTSHAILPFRSHWISIRMFRNVPPDAYPMRGWFRLLPHRLPYFLRSLSSTYSESCFFFIYWPGKMMKHVWKSITWITEFGESLSSASSISYLRLPNMVNIYITNWIDPPLLTDNSLFQRPFSIAGLNSLLQWPFFNSYVELL